MYSHVSAYLVDVFNYLILMIRLVSVALVIIVVVLERNLLQIIKEEKRCKMINFRLILEILYCTKVL